jgi:hypothetical protein
MKKVANPLKKSKPLATLVPEVTAPFAITSDGQVLLNVAECAGRDIGTRATFTGVLVAKPEAQLALKTVGDAAADTASKIAASLPIKIENPAAAKPTSKRKCKAKSKVG